MRNEVRLLACVLLLTGAASGCAANASRAPVRGASETPERRRAAERRVAAAREMVSALEQRDLANEPLTPEFQDRWAKWSRRLRDAELAVTDDRAARIASAGRHVTWCRSMLDRLEGLIHAYKPGIIAQRYYLADAEHRLAEIRAER